MQVTFIDEPLPPALHLMEVAGNLLWMASRGRKNNQDHQDSQLDSNMNYKNILTVALATSFLAACGGGEGDSPMEKGYGAGQTYTYFDQGGLTWSSPSKGTYVFLQAFSGALAENAGAYCSQSTSTNGGPTTLTNFNKSTGWRLPTIDELRSLRAETPNPVNWPLVELWAEGVNKNRSTFDFEVWPQTYDFGAGRNTFGANADTKAHVTCVKPIDSSTATPAAPTGYNYAMHDGIYDCTKSGATTTLSVTAKFSATAIAITGTGLAAGLKFEYKDKVGFVQGLPYYSRNIPLTSNAESALFFNDNLTLVTTPAVDVPDLFFQRPSSVTSCRKTA